MTLKLNGATSGSVSLDAPATGSHVTLELPTDSIKPALILLASQAFTAASNVSVNNCFTAAYDNYQIIYSTSANTATTGDIQFRLRSGGVDSSAASYKQGSISNSWTNSVAAFGGTTSTAGNVGFLNAANDAFSKSINVFAPFLSQKTTWATSGPDDASMRVYSGLFNATTSFDGFSIIAPSGTFTGTVRVYGYRN